MEKDKPRNESVRTMIEESIEKFIIDKITMVWPCKYNGWKVTSKQSNGIQMRGNVPEDDLELDGKTKSE